MFNPSELEGEVDHSFFDSDCDDSSRDGGENIEKGLKAEKKNPPSPEQLHAKQTETTKGGSSPRTDETKKHLKLVDNNSSSRAERKENSCQVKEEKSSRASSVSSVACASNKVIHISSDSEADSNSQSERHNETFIVLLDEAREVDCMDVYSQRPNESEEDALPSKHSDSIGKIKQSPKKTIQNWRTSSPSPISIESSIDTDSDSSIDSPTLPKPNKTSLSPEIRRTRVGSAGSQDVPIDHTEESEDTVTDVSPLSSPDISPLQSLDLNHTEAKEGSLKEQQQQKQQQQQESVPSSGLSDMHQDEDSDQDVHECSLSLESQHGGKLVSCSTGGRNRKNYSFTNDEVRRIDRENQRLLRELSRHTPGPRPGPRPGSTTGKKIHMTSKLPHILLSHSALNRQREQQRIERENLVFLKKLESVKPTPGLNRSEQLKDYQRHIRILGAPSYPVCMSPTKLERSISKTPSGSRPASSNHHSSRAVSTTNFNKTPVPRRKEPPSAAWC
ncbi:cilia- and flagella-associated protein 97 isoform X2 [Pseudoliparis swirei]|uniref:cilia- and flagella-associated protein 97 isoform X2 n=1 Tax=Pseudoliparis swirei TaxID=2059687 RepID=UPI0024BE3E58|nr:cilia- and flagella-associated protein 97 isoform X2 [Pseudoliparis swirei]